VDDAKKLHTQITLAIDPKAAEQAAREADVEIKIIALQSLCQTEPARCSALIGDVLASNSAPRLKEAAITLLGRHGGREAVPALLNIARTGGDMNLRLKAIAALGRINDESVLEPLREQAMQPEFSDNGLVDTALHAIARHESPRAVQVLAELGMNARTLEGRKHAIYLLSTQRKGEPPVDELFRIYDSDQNIEIRKQVVAGLGSRISERAGERLAQIARTATNTELRSTAIKAIAQRSRSIPNRNTDPDLEVLLALYDSERDEELKDVIIDNISHYQSKRATQKLMEIVRSNAPIERRKKAISALSRSKDPDILRFLEDILK
jgi:HEAT repeat protein